MEKAITLCVTSPFELDMNRDQQQTTWRAFLINGTNHSSMAATLPYVMRRCEREGIPYVLEAHPGKGYYIKPLPKEE